MNSDTLSAPSDPNAPVMPASLVQLYQTGEYAKFEQEHRRGGTFGLTITDVVQEPIDMIDPELDEIVFTSVLRSSGTGAVDCGDGWQEWDYTKPFFAIQPPHQACALRLPRIHTRMACLPVRKLGLACGAELGAKLEHAMGRQVGLPAAARLIDHMWHAAAAPGPATNLLLDGAFLQLLGVVLSACGDERGLAPIAAIGDARLARAIDYIETHLTEPLTVGEIAAVAAMSPSHFARSFKSATGEAVWAFVVRRRTERAREMLSRTDLPQAIVAHRCGFSDASHLRRALRRGEGARESVA